MKSVAKWFLVGLALFGSALTGGFLGLSTGFFAQQFYVLWINSTGNWGAVPPGNARTLYMLGHFLRVGLCLGVTAGLALTVWEYWREWARSDPSSPAPEAERADAPVKLHSVYRDVDRRILVVTGPVEAEIVYDTNGWGESVYLNGAKVAQTSGMAWTWQLISVAPRVEFELRGEAAAFPAHIEAAVYNQFWKGIKDFRLIVAGRAVYEEKDGVLLTDCDRVRAGAPGGEPARDHLG